MESLKDNVEADFLDYLIGEDDTENFDIYSISSQDGIRRLEVFKTEFDA